MLLEGHLILSVTIEIVVKDVVAVVVTILPIRISGYTIFLRISTLQLCDGEQTQRVVASILTVVDATSNLPFLGNLLSSDDGRSDESHLSRELSVLRSGRA